MTSNTVQTSILASRSLLDNTQSAGVALGEEDEAKVGKAWPSWSFKDCQVSIASLRVMELIHFIKIGIQTELEPV